MENSKTRIRFIGLFALAGVGVVGCSASAESDGVPPTLSAATNGSDPGTTPLAQAPTPALSPEGIPEGYVRVPGALTHRSCVHEIPSGATVDSTGTVHDKTGAPLAHYDPCGYAPVILRHLDEARPSGGAVVPADNGWVEWTKQTIPSSATTWNFLQSIITVPPVPGYNSGQTLFYFNGLDSASHTQILQPVLQFGHSDAGDTGQSWAIAAWDVFSDGASFHTPLTAVNPGDTIVAQVYLWNVTQGYKMICTRSCQLLYGWDYTYEVVAYDQQTGAQEGELVDNFDSGGFAAGTTPPPLGTLFPNAYPAVYEAYSENECPESPVQFSDIALASDQDTGLSTNALNSVYQTYAPSAHITNTSTPSCFFQVLANSTTTVLD